jgi:hypothetical protein
MLDALKQWSDLVNSKDPTHDDWESLFGGVGQTSPSQRPAMAPDVSGQPLAPPSTANIVQAQPMDPYAPTFQKKQEGSGVMSTLGTLKKLAI